MKSERMKPERGTFGVTWREFLGFTRLLYCIYRNFSCFEEKGFEEVSFTVSSVPFLGLEVKSESLSIYVFLNLEEDLIIFSSEGLVWNFSFSGLDCFSFINALGSFKKKLRRN
jgi:tricorn protease-like protein